MDETAIGQRSWHSRTVEEVMRELGANTELGLTEREVQVRLQKYGHNVITPKKGKSPVFRLLLQFNQPLVYILIISGVVTAVLKEYTNSSVIFGVVLVNAIIGFIQEMKAVRSLDALSKTLSAQATVLRDGSQLRIDAKDLVPGDIVLIAAGDKIGADSRLVNSRELRTNESALTGESLPVDKKPGALADGTEMRYLFG